MIDHEPNCAPLLYRLDMVLWAVHRLSNSRRIDRPQAVAAGPAAQARGYNARDLSTITSPSMRKLSWKKRTLLPAE